MRNSRKASAGGSPSVPARSTAGLSLTAGEGAEFGKHRHPEMWEGEGGGCGGMEEECTRAVIQVWAPQ